jgi:hypothetical protein
LVLDNVPPQSSRRRTECLGADESRATSVPRGISADLETTLRWLAAYAVLFNRSANVINLAANRKILSLGAIEVVAQSSQRQSAEH